jgi:hypothetical protein
MDECRAAISAGNYQAADRLLEQLRTDVEAAWPTAGAERRQSMSRQVLELLEWARKMTLARRSHAQRKLREIRLQSAYTAPRTLPATRVEFRS